MVIKVDDVDDLHLLGEHGAVPESNPASHAVPQYGDVVPLEVVQDSPDEHEAVGHLVHHPGRVPAGQTVPGLVQTDKVVALRSHQRQIYQETARYQARLTSERRGAM